MVGMLIAAVGLAFALTSVAFDERPGSFALLCISYVISTVIITSSVGDIIKCLNKSA